MSLFFNQKITLDLTISRVQNVHCSQDDADSRNILITLSDNGKPYSIPSEVSIFLKISKPDNTYTYIDEDDIDHLFKNNDGTVSVILPEQATTVSGVCESEIQLISTSTKEIVSTAKFNIIVKKSVLSDKEIESSIDSNVVKKMIYHLVDFMNPHKVNKKQVGLGNVPNVTTNDQTPTYAEATELENISSGEKLSIAFGKIKKAISSLLVHINNFDNPHKTTKSQIQLGNVDNTSDVDKPVSTAQQKAIDDAYANSNKYTDKKVADLINGAPETMDTLKEVADAIEKNKSVVEALDKSIGTKANQNELDTHTGNDTIHITLDERTKWNDASDKKHSHNNKSVLDGITSELVQKWSNGSSLTGVKGAKEKSYRQGNVNLTPADIGALPISGGTLTGQLQVGEKVKIYTSSEGGNIQIISPDDIGLRWELDAFKGDLRFICFNNDGTVKKICQLTKDGALIANNATQSAAGLMSPKDKEKLDNLSDAATIGGDTAENITSFTSSDSADESASAWTNVSKLSSGEKHSSIFAKVSQMFKNVRYLYKMLGTTDISKIGNGTCTGAISSLNSSLANCLPLSGGTMTGNIEMGGHTLGGVGDLWLSDRGFLKGILDGKLSLSGGTMTGTIIGQHKLPGSTASDANGMVLGVQTTGNTGIFNGNGDGNGADVANLIIKSWYGVGFVDGCSGHGMTVGIDCRSGNITCNSITIRNVGSVTDLLNSKLPTSASCNKNWIWADVGGQPSWVWGGEDPNNVYIYNPYKFCVNGVGASAGDLRVGLSAEGANFRTYNKAGTAAVNGYTNLGSGNYRWKQLFATTATISTSDRNLKKNIHKLTDKHLQFFLKLQPVSFQFIDGDSGRTHIGFISQDVEQAMSECGLTDLDFAGFCKDQKTEVYFEEDENGDKVEKERPVLDKNGNPEYIYSLRYEEFIAIITFSVQNLWEKVSDIELKLAQLVEK